MRNVCTLCIFILALHFMHAGAQTEKDTADLRSAIDSIRDGRGMGVDPRGNIDTGANLPDTINTKPEIPTPPIPNNPNPHDPRPNPVHPNPPPTPGPSTNQNPPNPSNSGAKGNK